MVGFGHESASHVDEALSKSGVEDGLECPLCWEGLNSSRHLPYVLWCGHSLCKSCLLGLQWATVKLPVVPVQLPLFISCPWCQFLSCRLVWKGKLKYPCKNFLLLWLVESVGGDMRHCHDGTKMEDKPYSGAVASASHQFYYGVADQASSHRLWEILGAQQPSNVFFLHRWFKKMVSLCAQLMAKFMLLLLVMFILFCVLPFSTVILVVYFAATLIFAFPSFLAVYFAFPSLSWLLREIVT